MAEIYDLLGHLDDAEANINAARNEEEELEDQLDEANDSKATLELLEEILEEHLGATAPEDVEDKLKKLREAAEIPKSEALDRALQRIRSTLEKWIKGVDILRSELNP